MTLNQFQDVIKTWDYVVDCGDAKKSFEIRMSRRPNLLIFVTYLDNNKDQTSLHGRDDVGKFMMEFIFSQKLVGSMYLVKS